LAVTDDVPDNANADTVTPPVVYPLPEATSPVTLAHVVDDAEMFDAEVANAHLNVSVSKSNVELSSFMRVVLVNVHVPAAMIFPICVGTLF
jgi:hypothetical protein